MFVFIKNYEFKIVISKRPLAWASEWITIVKVCLRLTCVALFVLLYVSLVLLVCRRKNILSAKRMLKGIVSSMYLREIVLVFDLAGIILPYCTTKLGFVWVSIFWYLVSTLLVAFVHIIFYLRSRKNFLRSKQVQIDLVGLAPRETSVLNMFLSRHHAAVAIEFRIWVSIWWTRH